MQLVSFLHGAFFHRPSLLRKKQHQCVMICIGLFPWKKWWKMAISVNSNRNPCRFNFVFL
ncbi:hypothetical protein BC940DRAFT_307519 [Gongronella butleri]|nr:hypothetical protein BC940DRAFT_307519 [Gongronella butleri]